MTIYESIGQLDPWTTIQIFKDNYIYHHGEKKALEVLNTVESSDRIFRFINEASKDNQVPSSKTIELLMNSVSYFMLSRAETLCLGGLFTYKLWYNKTGQLVELDYSDDDFLLYELANLIVNCSEQKFTSKGNVFIDFFNNVHKLTADK
jgi:hypothetical protein